MPRKRCIAAAGIPDFPGTEGGAGPMDLEQTAIERLKMASDMSLRLYKQQLVITYSGGARGRPART